jgi:hypothetical protein
MAVAAGPYIGSAASPLMDSVDAPVFVALMFWIDTIMPGV